MNKKIIIILLVIIILTISIASFFIIKNSKKEQIPVDTDKVIFSIDKIYIYSSASAENNSKDYERAYWDLNISQFSDIAIYINNKNSSEKLSPENTIKTLFIDNIQFTQLPNLGTPALYYKNFVDFGKNQVNKSNLIRNDIDFKIYSSDETDSEAPCFYTDCSNPITLGFINNNIASNYILLYDGTPITYNGKLLQKAGIYLDSIATTVSFNINIVNNLDESFICNVIIPITLQEGTHTIYSGDIETFQTTRFEFNKI